MGLAVPAVLAPIAAIDFGAAPTELGRWVGFAYMVAMFAGLAGGTLVGRYGAARVHLAAVLLVALRLGVGAGAQPAPLLLAGALLGAAPGLVTPASSAIRAAASPPPFLSTLVALTQTAGALRRARAA